MQRRVERTINSRRKEPKMKKGGTNSDPDPILRTIPKGTVAAFGAGLLGMAGQAISRGVKKRKAVNEIMDETGLSRKSARQKYNKEVNQGLRSTLKTGGVPCAKCGMSMKTGGSANKKLAAMYGNPNKVTRGDIITAAIRNKKNKRNK